jgi:hypothetical protein
LILPGLLAMVDVMFRWPGDLLLAAGKPRQGARSCHAIIFISKMAGACLNRQFERLIGWRPNHAIPHQRTGPSEFR